MIKWDLYRMKVEMIEDDYAEFKRRQKRIMWWLQIVLTHLSAKKAAGVFYDYRDALYQKQLLDGK